MSTIVHSWAPRPVPRPRVAELWNINHADGRPPESLVAAVSPAERQRAALFARTDLGHAFLWSRGLQRLTLSSYTGIDPRAIEFDRTCRHCGAGHGKPRVVGVDTIDFSVSNSGRSIIVGVVTAPAEIGVDIEMWSSTDLAKALADTIYGDDEAAPADARDLLSHWVRKEALLKATGHGLSVRPSDISLVSTESGRWGVIRAGHLLNGDSWQILDVEAVEGPVAVAVSEPVDTVLSFDISARSCEHAPLDAL